MEKNSSIEVISPRFSYLTLMKSDKAVMANPAKVNVTSSECKTLVMYSSPIFGGLVKYFLPSVSPSKRKESTYPTNKTSNTGSRFMVISFHTTGILQHKESLCHELDNGTIPFFPISFSNLLFLTYKSLIHLAFRASFITRIVYVVDFAMAPFC